MSSLYFLRIDTCCLNNSVHANSIVGSKRHVSILRNDMLILRFNETVTVITFRSIVHISKC